MLFYLLQIFISSSTNIQTVLEGKWNISVCYYLSNKGIESNSLSSYYSLDLKAIDDHNLSGTLHKYLNRRIDDAFNIKFIQSYNSPSFYIYNVNVSKKDVEKVNFDLNITIDSDELVISTGSVLDYVYSVKVVQPNFAEITTFNKRNNKVTIYRLDKQKEKKFGLRYLFPNSTIIVTIFFNIFRLFLQWKQFCNIVIIIKMCFNFNV